MWRYTTGAALAALMLTACGGGSDNGSLLGPGFEDGAEIEWQPGVFPNSEQFKDICAAPREGADPFNNNQPYPDRDGEYYHENFWLRSWVNELYLWYDEVPDLNPFNYSIPVDYFAQLKTSATTASGNLKDNFHFAANTEEYNNSQIGIEFGYGIDFYPVSLESPRELRVIDVYPGSPADQLGVRRGMQVLEIDGIDFVATQSGVDIDAINSVFQATEQGVTHTFLFEGLGEVELTTGTYSDSPVKNVSVLQTDTGNVGYMMFKAHNPISEKLLFDGFNELADAGVSDLILDMRYNGGGLGVIASQVAYMIAGEANTANRDFLIQQYNDKYEDVDPFSGEPNQPMPFIPISLGLTNELAAEEALPQLNLSRVFILSTSGTCSASELLINGLRGIGIEVILIGDTTCGKPYGFVPQDNCGTTYFSIQIAAVNDLEFGAYSEGFTPTNKPNFVGVEVPGCWSQDDYSRAFGDSQEALLAAALQYRATGTCPAINTTQAKQQDRSLQKSTQAPTIQFREKPWRNNLVIQPDQH